jgi:di/tricarboxylate transporter
MTLDAWLTLGLLVATLAALLGTKLPPALVFMGALTVSITLGLAPLAKSLAGFSNDGVITVGVLFMVAAGMYSTGAITLIGEKIIGTPKSEDEVQLRVLPPVALGSAFLNNTPLVAMTIPVIRDLCVTRGFAASRLFIPISYASILGGTTTLIGTSVNLIIGGLILDQLARGSAGAPPMRQIQMFDPAWVAVPGAVLGIAFIILAGRWLLPTRESGIRSRTGKRIYGAEFVLRKGSPEVGKTLEEAGLADPIGFELKMIPMFWTTLGVRPYKEGHPMATRLHTHSLVEVVISPQSTAVGRKVSELPLPDSPYQVSLVAVSRGGKPIPGRLDDIRVEVGDNAILEVDDSFFYVSQSEHDFSLVKPLEGYSIRRWHRALTSSLIMAAMVALVTLGWMSMLNAALLASGAMLLSGCMSLRTAARSVDWATLATLASAIGVAAAVSESGLADVIAGVLQRFGASEPYTALAVIFLGHAIMGNLITTAASAVFMFPIALALAGSLGVSFMPFAIALMTGMVGATITPAAYQTNLMVYEPGGYTTMDFVKLGVPLTLIIGAVTIFLAPLAFPF